MRVVPVKATSFYIIVVNMNLERYFIVAVHAYISNRRCRQNNLDLVFYTVQRCSSQLLLYLRRFLVLIEGIFGFRLRGTLIMLFPFLQYLIK